LEGVCWGAGRQLGLFGEEKKGLIARGRGTCPGKGLGISWTVGLALKHAD